MSMKMTVQEYVDKVKRSADEFAIDWAKHNQEDPHNWPATFEEIDWDDQFIVWLEVQEKV